VASQIFKIIDTVVYENKPSDRECPIVGLDISQPVKEAHEAGVPALLRVRFDVRMYQWMQVWAGWGFGKTTNVMQWSDNPIAQIFRLAAANKTYCGIVLEFFKSGSWLDDAKTKPAEKAWLNFVPKRIVENFETGSDYTIVVASSETYVSASSNGSASAADWMNKYNTASYYGWIPGLSLWDKTEVWNTARDFGKIFPAWKTISPIVIPPSGSQLDRMEATLNRVETKLSKPLKFGE